MNCQRGPQSRSRLLKIVQGQDDLLKSVVNRTAKRKLQFYESAKA